MKQTHVCPQCGKTFERYESHIRVKQPCCSTRCALKYRSQTSEQGKQSRKVILEFVAAFIRENGYSPSIREIVGGTGRSQASVYYNLDVLEKAGCITRKPNITRTIRVVEED